MQVSLGSCYFGGDDPATIIAIKPGGFGWVAVCERHRESAERGGLVLAKAPAPVPVAEPGPEPGVDAAPEPEPATVEAAFVEQAPAPRAPDRRGTLPVNVVLIDGDTRWSKAVEFLAAPRVDDRLELGPVSAVVELLVAADAADPADAVEATMPTAVARVTTGARVIVLDGSWARA